jgi:hypothetical protein
VPPKRPGAASSAWTECADARFPAAEPGAGALP